MREILRNPFSWLWVFLAILFVRVSSFISFLWQRHAPQGYALKGHPGSSRTVFWMSAMRDGSPVDSHTWVNQERSGTRLPHPICQEKLLFCLWSFLSLFVHFLGMEDCLAYSNLLKLQLLIIFLRWRQIFWITDRDNIDLSYRSAVSAAVGILNAALESGFSLDDPDIIKSVKLSWCKHNY